MPITSKKIAQTIKKSTNNIPKINNIGLKKLNFWSIFSLPCGRHHELNLEKRCRMNRSKVNLEPRRPISWTFLIFAIFFIFARRHRELNLEKRCRMNRSKVNLEPRRPVSWTFSTSWNINIFSAGLRQNTFFRSLPYGSSPMAEPKQLEVQVLKWVHIKTRIMGKSSGLVKSRLGEFNENHLGSLERVPPPGNKNWPDRSTLWPNPHPKKRKQQKQRWSNCFFQLHHEFYLSKHRLFALVYVDFRASATHFEDILIFLEYLKKVRA